MIGGLLVAVSFVGLYALATGVATPETHGVLVTSQPLPPGARLDPAVLEVAQVDLPAATLDQLFGADERSALDGHVLLAPMAPGELLQRSALRDSGPQDHDDPVGPEVSFDIESDRAVGGRLVSGETVDVLVTYGTGSSSATEVVAEDAMVLDVAAGSERSIADGGTLTITLALGAADSVIAVVHASQVGSITLIRSAPERRSGRGDVYRPDTGQPPPVATGVGP